MMMITTKAAPKHYNKINYKAFTMTTKFFFIIKIKT